MNTPQEIRAIPSKKGGYNISPKWWISYPDRVILNIPSWWISVIRRSVAKFNKMIKKNLKNGYTIDNARLSPEEIVKFQVQGYIDKILSKK
jgi:hypothetical protein